MSRPVHRIPAKVIALLHERGMTCKKLGQLACLSERHVIRLLGNHPQAKCREKLIPWLTVQEVTFLNWGNLQRTGVWIDESPTGPTWFHAKQDKLSQTEQTRGAVPAVATGGNAPEGPGTDGNKPLMRNREPIHAASAMGLLPAPLSPVHR